LYSRTHNTNTSDTPKKILKEEMGQHFVLIFEVSEIQEVRGISTDDSN
jgi:hypothetical protein